ncbi:MAG: succinate dehydrogenase iron-sulfur subunit [SAR324 cluster bacterium]|nr:succinate dehydrogenase iron-sulfur subunit [SAR324 cluster bacterium]MCZ6626883.1 succinate dehydrogenase iron-sulfur subunit [SAR324 cluster bacterium]
MGPNKVHGNITVKILRSDGAEGAPARFQTFQVAREPKMSVLDAVAKIQSTQDASLAYRYSCRAGMCGTCSMRVNGKNRWTCRTSVDNLKSDTITLEPLPNYPVIRDLAVDMKPFFENYRKAIPQFIPAQPRRADFARIPQDAPERQEINQHVECITCGNCFGACSLVGSSSAYLGPAALNRAYVLISDSRDGAARERLDILNAHSGVWGCHTQFNCSDACPMGISPTRAIQKLKRKEILHAFTRPF